MVVSISVLNGLKISNDYATEQVSSMITEDYPDISCGDLDVEIYLRWLDSQSDGYQYRKTLTGKITVRSGKDFKRDEDFEVYTIDNREDNHLIFKNLLGDTFFEDEEEKEDAEAVYESYFDSLVDKIEFDSIIESLIELKLKYDSYE